MYRGPPGSYHCRRVVSPPSRQESGPLVTGVPPATDVLLERIAALEGRVADLESSRAELRVALNRLGDALAQSHDRRAIMAAVAETSVFVLEAKAAVFYRIVAGADRLRPGAVVGAQGDVGELSFGEGVAGSAARSDRVLVWPGSTRPASAEPAPAGASAVAAPVRPGGRPFGVLALYGRSVDHPFTDDDVETLQTLVRQVETAIENTYLYEEATHLSLTDGLTGLWNRRHFDLRLSDELQRAVRFGEPFAVLLTDLDRFKAVNDNHGHQVGDAALVELAARLTGTTREVDEVARFGLGDEFTLLLPKTGLAGALRLAEKVRQAVEAEPFRVEGLSLPLTASVGVAACPEHGSSSKHLVQAADEALLRAKAHGGNRVEHAKTPRAGRLSS